MTGSSAPVEGMGRVCMGATINRACAARKVSRARPEAHALPSRMKKTFLLAVEGKNRDRIVDAVKHEIRKYVKRERRRELPAGVDFLDFDCRFGLTPESAPKPCT